MTENTGSESRQELGGVRTQSDPTQALLSESSLNKKFLCDYVVNTATGCRHGCKYCYVPSTPQIRTRPEMLRTHADVENPQQEWGTYVLYRDELADELDDHLGRKRTWKETRGGQGIVGVSFSTDCYMDARAASITRGVVDALTDHKKYTRVLTRNPILALQDLDVFTENREYVTVGTSLPSLDAEAVRAIEPRAPAPKHRLRGLEEFREHDVKTFVSLSPLYPMQDRGDLRALLERVAECEPDVVFTEPLNPRGGNLNMTVEAVEDAGLSDLATELDALRSESEWVEYSLRQLQTIQEIAVDLELPVHLWPDEKLINAVTDEKEQWLREWKTRQSPEDFAGRPDPESAVPPSPCNSGF